MWLCPRSRVAACVRAWQHRPVAELCFCSLTNAQQVRVASPGRPCEEGCNSQVRQCATFVCAGCGMSLWVAMQPGCLHANGSKVAPASSASAARQFALAHTGCAYMIADTVDSAACYHSLAVEYSFAPFFHAGEITDPLLMLPTLSDARGTWGTPVPHRKSIGNS